MPVVSNEFAAPFPFAAARPYPPVGAPSDRLDVLSNAGSAEQGFTGFCALVFCRLEPWREVVDGSSRFSGLL
jgi:hypothetical protein